MATWKKVHDLERLSRDSGTSEHERDAAGKVARKLRSELEESGEPEPQAARAGNTKRPARDFWGDDDDDWSPEDYDAFWERCRQATRTSQAARAAARAAAERGARGYDSDPGPLQKPTHGPRCTGAPSDPYSSGGCPDCRRILQWRQRHGWGN